MANRWTAILFVVCLALLLTPIAAVAYLPLADYPNHLARLFILTHPDDPVLAEYYRVNWSLLPNLGFDLVGYALAQAVPVQVAGRLFLAMTLAVQLAALMVLHRVLYGRWSPLPLLAGPLLYNLAVQMGLLSFVLGIGLAILVFALWLGLRGAGAARRFAALQLAVLVLFVCHLAATAVLALLVVTSAASEGWRGSPGRVRARLGAALRQAAPAAAAFILPLLLLLASKTGGTAGEGVGYDGANSKLVMISLSLTLNLSVTGIALAAPALLAPAAVARFGGGRMLHPLVRWPVALLALIYLPMPDKLLSSHMADWRLLVPLVLIATAAAEMPALRRRGVTLVAALALGLNAGAAWNAWNLWRPGDAIASELRSVLADLPEGARLIPYQPGRNFAATFAPPSLFHIPTLAVIERRALVPSVFANPGQQPIALQEPHAIGYEWFLGLHQLGPVPQQTAWLTDPANHVLMIRSGREAGEVDRALPVAADLVTQSEHFALYRLRPGPATR